MANKQVLINRQTGHRESNIELFRIISMLLIVAHHYVMNSGISELMLDNQLVFKSIFFYLSGAWGKTAINCFVMITGYFMCTSRITLKKLKQLRGFCNTE